MRHAHRLGAWCNALNAEEKTAMNGYVIAAAKPTGFGLLAFGLLLAAYFAVLTLVSGWKFTVDQFSEFWFYILPLAAGFGLQVTLYMRLRQLLRSEEHTSE